VDEVRDLGVAPESFKPVQLMELPDMGVVAGMVFDVNSYDIKSRELIAVTRATRAAKEINH
jgi:hypothetical protein